MSAIYVEISDREYKIWSDKHNWMFAEYCGETKNGNDDIRNTRYYSRIEHMIDGLVRQGLRESEYDSISDIRDNLSQIRDKINSLFDSDVLEE